MSDEDVESDASDGDTAGLPAELTGSAAFERQIAGIAEDRGLARSQVAGTRELANMPDVTPTAFAAIAGVIDCLCNADRNLADGEQAAQRTETDDQ